MFELNVRFQIAAIIVFLIILLDFVRYPKLNVFSTRIFKTVLAVVACNLVFDVMSVYTVNHLDEVPAFANRLVHQFFIASVILAMLINFLYIYVMATNQRRFGLASICLISVPFIVSMFFVFFGDLYYHTGDHGAYSYGPMANVVYACGVIYLLGIVAIAMNRRNHLNRKQRGSVLMEAMVWVLALAVQMWLPHLLLSGLGFVIMLLVIYLAFETQKENVEYEMGLFNQKAFFQMFNEYFEQKNALTVVNIVLENYERIHYRFGEKVVMEALEHVLQCSNTYCPMNKYHIRSDAITVLCQKTPQQCREVFVQVAKLLEVDSFEHCALQCHIDILNVRESHIAKENVLELVDFMNKQRYGENCSLRYLVREMMAYKRRYDRIDMLLTKALEEDGFEVVYQPIFSTKHNAFVSAEALIRMKEDEELGYISPEEFIPIAEEKGLILAIGDVVMDKVAAFLAKSKLLEKGLEYIEVNLSGIQIAAVDICPRLLAILDKYQISPSKINLELTETANGNDDKRQAENVRKLMEAGFRFSMDDFGTGYSNLAQMSKVAFDIVKLDKSLIWNAFARIISKDAQGEMNAQGQKKAQSMLYHVIEMVKAQEMRIVAEGIETAEMVEYLKAQGVDYLQGAYYSRPLREAAFVEFIVGQ